MYMYWLIIAGDQRIYISTRMISQYFRMNLAPVIFFLLEGDMRKVNFTIMKMQNNNVNYDY